MSLTLLKTKLFLPPLQPVLVPRPRLSQQIETAIQSGAWFTLVAAPAGFGKTTAISAWVHEYQQQAAWVSLDEGDNEPVIFWAYVIAALQINLPDFAKALSASLEASPPATIDSLLLGLVNELASLDQPVCLILDDYHRIDNQAIHDGLIFLLNHQPPQLHLVVITRADPPLPLARWRAQRILAELRSQDLRFTLEEAQTLLNEIMELDLTADDICLLQTRTEGWGVGLLLAAQSMQGRQDRHEFITAFSGSHHYILEYLVEEVLNRQPTALREFLLQTSILEQLSGPLCDVVTGMDNSGATLAKLQKDNLFLIPLDTNHTWFRYHHLFADLLANHLRNELDQEQILNLHRRASLWYQEQDRLDKAVKYALSGQDFQRAADLIEAAAGMIIARGQVKTLLQWLNALPEVIVQTRPQLLMRLGWATFLSGKVTQASQILKQAQQVLDSVPSSGRQKLLQGQVSAMLATLTVLTSDISGAMAEARQALENLPPEEFVYRARATRVLGVCYMFQGEMAQALAFLKEAKTLALNGQNKFLASEILSQIATVRKHQAKLTQAHEAYQQVLQLFETPEEAPPACLGYIGMAEITLERNELAAAEDYLSTGIELCYKGNIGYPLQPAYLIRGLLNQANGDRRAALEAIQKGENLSRAGGGSLESILGLAWFQGRLNLQIGELELAKQWATGERLPPGWSFDALPLVLYEMQQSLLARVYLKMGKFEQVLDIHAILCSQAQDGGRFARVIELSLFKALALQAIGRGNEALEVFKRCLELAEPEGYTRLFLEEGESVESLLRQVADGDTQSGYASRLLHALGDKQATTIEALIEPLTARELQVLRLICEGRSNRQIAERLVVSINTIKKHTSNIYGKLGARNRAQAVIRAREIGLV